MIGALLLAVITLQSPLAPNDRLDRTVARVVEQTVTQFGPEGLKADQIAITVVEIDRSAQRQSMGHHKGNEAFYPASVVKLFYLAYSHRLLQDKKVKPTAELDRALSDMIRDSSNDATGLVLDAITDTTGGPELPLAALKAWMAKRDAVNRWFKSMGYDKINVNQKTWSEGPYGRERQGYGPNMELRNSLTSNTAARLMTEIALHKMVSTERSKEMLKLLKRAIPAETRDPDYQSAAFIGKSLSKGSELYSKAGYTDSVRHDVAYIKLPSGKELVLSIFTQGNSNRTQLIPFIADLIVKSYATE